MNMRHKRLFYTIAVTMIVVFSTTYAILMTLERMDYRNYLQGEYSKSLYQLIDNLESIDNNLGKSLVAGTKEQKTLLLQDIFRNASSANDKVSSLPIPVQISQGVNKFLSQVGDYSYTLAKRTDNEKLKNNDLVSQNDSDTIDKLEIQSRQLKNQLNGILANMNQGRVSWGEIRQKITNLFAAGSKDDVSAKFMDVQKQVAMYPSLIYDGPFSDNVLEIQPKVNSLPQISEQQAKDFISNLLGKDNVQTVQLIQSTNNSKIPVYSFNIKEKNRRDNENIICDISKAGGKIVYLLDNKSLDSPKLDDRKAMEAASAFLNGIGYIDMQPSFFQRYEDNMVINYVYIKDKVAIYPDQIKIKVALSDGSIIGFEGEKYLVAHDDNRKNPAPQITSQQAKKSVSDNLSIYSSRLAIVPTENNKEILCYEFAGKYKEEEFIVYIDAANGNSQNILKIINTPNGKLTI